MPYKNKTKNNYNPRHLTRRSNRPHMQSAIPNQLYANGFPRQMKVKLVYFQSGFVNAPSGGVPYDYQFRLNSLFDPDYTSTGHQPLGYDQYAAFYGRYRVDSCSVQTQFTGSTNFHIAVLGNNTTASITAQSEAEESPFSSGKLYAPGGPPVSISRHFDLAALNGVTKSTYENDDRYQSVFAANPTESLQLHCVMTCTDNTPSACTFAVKLTYYCTLYDPIQQTLS